MSKTDTNNLSPMQLLLLKSLRAERTGDGFEWCQIFKSEVRSAKVLEKKGLIELSYAKIRSGCHLYEARAA